MIRERTPVRHERVGVRFRITGGTMPTVERTGIYRNERGHALFLRKDRIVGDDVAASYAIDDAAALSPARQAIADADNGPAAVAGADVTAEEVNTTGEVETPEPAPVAPGGRRKRRNAAVETPEDAMKIETPEDAMKIETPEDAMKIETPEDGAPKVETPEDSDVAEERA